ncbi:hypothetical protein [Duganella sp. CY15W]|uniref:hypothetical protein n=1 Tax=Duganella sp. CY15W TaxID=2692172 RepID=UPI001E5EE880|nr:hypothetical protein [Duganella sp. CY15W]
MDTVCATVGIDVSKQKLDIALLVDGKIKTKVVENSAPGHQASYIEHTASSPDNREVAAARQSDAEQT